MLRSLLLKALLLFLALMPAAAVAAPWQLAPATRVAVDVAWEGRTVTVRFPTLSGQIDFDRDHPERAQADDQRRHRRRHHRRRRGRRAAAQQGLSRRRGIPGDHLPSRQAHPDLQEHRRRRRPDHPARRDAARRLQGRGHPLRPVRRRPGPLRGRLRPDRQHRPHRVRLDRRPAAGRGGAAGAHPPADDARNNAGARHHRAAGAGSPARCTGRWRR